MNAAIVRRLSFGAGQRRFPFDKYLSAMNNPENENEIMVAYDSWTAEDIEQATSIEQRHDHLQKEATELEAQYIEHLARQKFIEALADVSNLEDLPHNPDNRNNTKRMIKQVKRERQELDGANRKITQELYAKMGEMVSINERVKTTRGRLEEELQQVKSEINTFPEEKENNMTDTSITSQPTTDSNPVSVSKFYNLNAMISSFSGVEISEFNDNRVTFNLAVRASGTTHHYTLSVEFEPFDNCAIRHLSPEISMDAIFNRAKREDTQFLISETMNYIRNMWDTKSEIEHIIESYPSTQWNGQLLSVTHQGRTLRVELPIDYPMSTKLQYEAGDGVESTSGRVAEFVDAFFAQ